MIRLKTLIIEQKLPYDINAAKAWFADREILSIKAYGGGKIKISYKNSSGNKRNYFGETEDTKIKINVGGYELGAHIPHGHGTMNGDNNYGVFKGNFANGTMSGYGVYTWPDGDIYKGNYIDGNMSGYGKMYDINGTLKQKGFWVADVYTGDSKKNSNNTQSSTSWFEYPGDTLYIYQQRDNAWWAKNLKNNKEYNISTNPKYQSSVDRLNSANAANKLIAK